MSSKGKLILAGVGALLVAVIVILLLPGKGGGDREPEQDKGFRLPSYVKLDAPDTYHGLVDITGTWVNTLTPSDTITFCADGAYISSAFAVDGTYKLEDGYVAMTSVAETYEALRMVTGNGVDIFLQMDDESLPKKYRRVLSDEALEEPSFESDEEEILRHYLSSINQILQKSTWFSETDGVDKIIILKDSIQLYAGSELASEWVYDVLAPSAEDGVPFDPPYTVPVMVDGREYTLCLDAGTNPEYSVGYTLSISDGSNTLLLARSTAPIVFEEP